MRNECQPAKLAVQAPHMRCGAHRSRREGTRQAPTRLGSRRAHATSRTSLTARKHGAKAMLSEIRHRSPRRRPPKRQRDRPSNHNTQGATFSQARWAVAESQSWHDSSYTLRHTICDKRELHAIDYSHGPGERLLAGLAYAARCRLRAAKEVVSVDIVSKNPWD